VRCIAFAVQTAQFYFCASDRYSRKQVLACFRGTAYYGVASPHTSKKETPKFFQLSEDRPRVTGCVCGKKSPQNVAQPKRILIVYCGKK
jgi:hypothetical protein